MITYPADIEAYIQGKLASGEFQSHEDFATAAAQLYREIEATREQLLEDVRAGIAEADQGLCEPLEIAALKAEILANMDEDGRRK
jgi:Arc/MetJ-type ribon-helix-helix transcriptional regulator